jgi:hypothetical protein
MNQIIDLAEIDSIAKTEPKQSIEIAGDCYRSGCLDFALHLDL